ncbi:MAG: type IV toxin-antitoxin system AbiEi family antitoxin domain-containing protein [Solirubrobacterales bacterium]
MGTETSHGKGSGAWSLAKRQHGVVSRRQLLELGLDSAAIVHRVATGRLHRVHRGVYAVGRPELSREGRWMAAVLRCGAGAVLSHGSAAEAWGFAPGAGRTRTGRERIEVSVDAGRGPRAPGIRVHRRRRLPGEHLRTLSGVPLTSPLLTLVDISARLSLSRLERAVGEADKLGLLSSAALRSSLGRFQGRPGVARLCRLLDRDTFAVTDSELERRFLAILRDANLPAPETGRVLNGFRVDFFWADLGLVVETDGLRYHRTPAQQARDRIRDQAHTRAGLTALRFTHAQVFGEPGRVVSTIAEVMARTGTPGTRGK